MGQKLDVNLEVTRCSCSNDVKSSALAWQTSLVTLLSFTVFLKRIYLLKRSSSKVGCILTVFLKHVYFNFIFCTASSIVGHREAGASVQQSTGERRGPPWVTRQSVAGNTETHGANNQAHLRAI
ncbi:hypothetical protein CRENBAI_012026 [Crenichthys baileyi]|uniref:Uncharacterized protein n=1 Tax=Crenichthys baileyi TaxID=28760 RepID=A0AAV9RUA3_9TELE